MSEENPVDPFEQDRRVWLEQLLEAHASRERPPAAEAGPREPAAEPVKATPRELLQRLVNLKDRKTRIGELLNSRLPAERAQGREAMVDYMKEREVAWNAARALLAAPERAPDDFAQRLFNRSAADLWREYCAVKAERDELRERLNRGVGLA